MHIFYGKFLSISSRQKSMMDKIVHQSTQFLLLNEYLAFTIVFKMNEIYV